MPRNSRENQKSYTNVYHVILRSINQQEIFYDSTDRNKFIKTIKETKEKYDYELYAYVLMDNHVHLLIMDKEQKLSKIVQSLAISYALYFNKKYNRIGHVFYNRFKSKSIKNLSSLLRVARYIHFNPEKAGVCEFSKYYWSSYHEYFGFPSITDCSQMLKLVEMDTKIFEEFHKEYQKNKGYEQDNFEIESTKLSDEELIFKIKKQLNIENLLDIQKLKKLERDEIIVKICSDNKIEKRQLARVLGINERTIHRAIYKFKNNINVKR